MAKPNDRPSRPLINNRGRDVPSRESTTMSVTSREPYIGARVTRREDERLLRGEGEYIADIRLAGLLDVALIRSPLAHATVQAVQLDAVRDRDGVVLALSGDQLASELPPIPGMQVAAAPGWTSRVHHEVNLPAQPILAIDRVRYVGEPIAAVVATTETAARDVAEDVEVSLRPLQPLVDASSATTSPVRIHDDVPDNSFATMSVAKGDVASALARAPHRLRRQIVHHRYAAMPIECRGVVADYDRRTDALTIWVNSQVVHWVQAEVARSLGLSESQIRVIAPDVGGGFGVKGHVYPEEILVAYLARRLGRPVRWLERRDEHFLSATHSRDTAHVVEVGFDDDGRVLALASDGVVDSGAYSPVGAGVAYNITAHMLGPYDIANFSASTTIVATNKVPNAPYRGAGRPEATHVMERIMDIVSVAVGREPADVRLANMITAEQMPYAVELPYRDGQPIVYDSGDYPKALDQALTSIGGVAPFRERQREARKHGRYLGLGIGCYTEGTGVGPFEGARVALDRSGKLIVAIGACPQGQGHETVFAQVAADIWQVPLSDIIIRGADTATVQMGYGTVGSRSTVTGSMAIQHASVIVKDKVLAVAGELLEVNAADLEIRNGAVNVVGAPQLNVSLADIAKASLPGWQHRRPPNVTAGLEGSAYYEPPTVTWSYAANAAIVEIDPETGTFRIEKYVEVHDAGVLVNPMLADGQVMGGIAQGIGGAAHEAMIYDAQGQLLTGSFLDYALPRATDIPPLTVIHHETPSPINPLGIKGLGEGGAIAPPVVLANALADAMRETGFEPNTLPLRPEALLKELRRRRGGTKTMDGEQVEEQHDSRRSS